MGAKVCDDSSYLCVQEEYRNNDCDWAVFYAGQADAWGRDYCKLSVLNWMHDDIRRANNKRIEETVVPGVK
jgi:hypothetical protein